MLRKPFDLADAIEAIRALAPESREEIA